MIINFSFIHQQKPLEIIDDNRLKMWLGFYASDNFYREILLTVDERTTDGIDKGFEADLWDEFPNDMYWVLGEKKLIIQAIGELQSDRVVPIGINSKGDSPIRIRVDTIENPYSNMEVFLRDNVTMETYDILNETFEISMGKGQFLDKYSLVFESKVEIEDEQEQVQDGGEGPGTVHEDEYSEVLGVVYEEVISELNVFIGEYSELLRIKRPDEITINKISLFNMIGQQMNTWSTDLEASRIDLPIHVNTGVYVVLLETNKGRVLEKVIIK